MYLLSPGRIRKCLIKNSEGPNALSGFQSIETLSQIIPIFFQSFPFVFCCNFDIPDAISCSRNDGINAKKFAPVCRIFIPPNCF